MSGRLFYGWVMVAVAVAVAVILLGAGTRAAPGALLLPIQADTGWTTSQVTPGVLAPRRGRPERSLAAT